MRTSTLELAGRARLGVDARPARPATRIAKAGLILALIAGAVMAQGCGGRYFTATVAGYVRDKDGNGVNGASIRVYMSNPADNSDAPFFTAASMTSGGNDGYWSRKVQWNSADPTFQDEGDTESVWVDVRRAGYFPVVKEIPGVLSDSNNVLVSVEVEAIRSTEVRVQVLEGDIPAPDGVRVVLDLVSTEDTEEDYVVETARVDGKDGIAIFRNVAWEDEGSLPRQIVGGAAYEEALVYVDDEAYYSTNFSKSAPISLTLNSRNKSDLTADASKTIRVKTATFVAAMVSGSVKTEGGSGVSGVRVLLDVPSTAAIPDFDTRTDDSGGFSFSQVSWIDTTPELSGVEDKETIRIWVDDSAYRGIGVARESPLVVEEALSGSAGVAVGDIPVRKVFFKKDEIKGRFTTSGRGVNGVEVVLDLGSTSGTRDYAATTSYQDSLMGVFKFAGVEWTDESPESPESEDYSIVIGASGFAPKTIRGQLQEGGVASIDLGAVELTRTDAWSFSAVVEGRYVFKESGKSAQGIEGARVAIKLNTGEAANDGIVSTNVSSKLEVFTDAQGRYQATVTWVRPKDYLLPDAGVPDGALDSIVVDVSCEAGTAPGNQYAFPDVEKYSIWASMAAGRTNTAPTQIDTDPNS